MGMAPIALTVNRYSTSTSFVRSDCGKTSMDAKGEKVGVKPSLLPTSSEVEPSVVEIVTVAVARSVPGFRMFASFRLRVTVVPELITPFSIQFSIMTVLLALKS